MHPIKRAAAALAAALSLSADAATSSTGNSTHHQMPATMAVCWLAQKIMLPTVGVLMSVKPSTACFAAQ